MNFKLKTNFKNARGSKLPKSRKDNSDCIPMETPILKDEPPEEDQRLVNWKRWLSDRESRQQHLSKALRREPLDLRLNAHERVRTKNETKCFLQSAVRPEITKQDRYRGNPAFWKTPYKLMKDPDDDVRATMSLEDRCLPPAVTRVGLPQLICKEKNLVKSCMDQSKIDLTSKWECGDYLQKRTAELKHELKAMESKTPDMDDLIIVGKNFSCGDQECLLRTPVITITTCEIKKKLLSHPEERIALKIQEREFVLERGHHFEKLSRKRSEELRESKEDKEEHKYAYSVFESDRVYKIVPKKCKSLTWTLTFETEQNESCIRYLTLENKGVRALNVDWRNASPTSTLLPISERFESRFFFNKNQFSILPGQKIEIPIGFSSKKPAVFTETWKLLIEPKIYPRPLYLRLYATSSGEFWKNREARHQKCIKDYIRHRVRDSIIRDIVEEVFLQATNERPVEVVPYHLFFLESEIFEVRNPTYFYYSPLVNELKNMYQEITEVMEDEEEEHEEVLPWNLSLKELRWRLLKISDPVSRCHKLVRFQKICDECLRPNTLYSRPSFSKKKLVYWILCSFFNQFEVESDFVMRKCCFESNDSNPAEEDARSNVNNSEAGEGESVDLVCNDPKMYREVYRIRIYSLLCDAIGKICAVVDTHNYFHGERYN